MSFIGAVATSVRQVLAQYAKDVHLPCLIVGAGNFTVPSVLRSAGFAGTITACDVTLYTSALGAYLSGWTLEAREREDCPEHLRGLLRTGSPLELTASISLLMDLREVWKGDNAFKMRMVEHSREAWDTLMEKTCAKLESYKAHIGPIDYQARDGFDLLEKSASGHTVFAFPPTYKAGYEKLEALLRATVEWTPGLPGNDRQEFGAVRGHRPVRLVLRRAGEGSPRSVRAPRPAFGGASPGAGPHDLHCGETRQKSRDPFLGQDSPGRPHLAREPGRVRGRGSRLRPGQAGAVAPAERTLPCQAH